MATIRFCPGYGFSVVFKIPAMKGFVLAAGYGTRLLPITRYVPKVLVPLGDRVLAEYALDFLRRAGVVTIGINAHSFSYQIQRFGDLNRLQVFHEPELLGTGGYLRGLGSFFDEELLVVNGDALFFNDADFASRLFARHRKMGNLITLGVMKRLSGSVATGITVRNGRVLAIGEGDCFFTGFQLLSPDVLPMVKTASILPLFQELIRRGKLGAEFFEGDWFDCGTRTGLLAAHRFITGLNEWVYPGAKVEIGAQIQNSVVYPGGTVRGGGVLVDSILFQGEIVSGQIVREEIFA